MRDAYTVVYGLGVPHMNVGPTFPEKDEAVDCAVEENGAVMKVVSHVEDFDSKVYGYFTVRTDMNHEISFVVTTGDVLDEWREIDNGDTAFVNTPLYESWEDAVAEGWR